MKEQLEILDKKGFELVRSWRSDWCKFVREALGAQLDKEQEAILSSVQHNKMTSVASGTARGKDFVTACAALSFFYLTPEWDNAGHLVSNTKVVLSAPTDRQVQNVMVPEFTRLFLSAKRRGVELPGRLTGYDIRTSDKEWFLTGFRADPHNHEAWSGLHASNIMFGITEATGIEESIYNAIEGNLQGFSRLLIVFNPNVSIGYAASSQKSKRWKAFRLDSLNAPNVKQKKQVIPGQVDYEWVKDKVETWCSPIAKEDYLVEEGDFEWEGRFYRPSDLFRVKIRGMFPKVSHSSLIPPEWIDLANKRWQEQQEQGWRIEKPIRMGVDCAGMGNDSTSFCQRQGHYVHPFVMIHSGGTANHMEIAGKTFNMLKANTDRITGVYAQAFIDTIGEGAGLYSRLEELATEKGNEWLKDRVHSVKFSEKADWQGKDLKDMTGQYTFLNMRAYLYWAVRDWLDPKFKQNAMLPPDQELAQELTETQWKFRSDGSIQIEAKEEIKKRIGRSPDKSDALANTFYPINDFDPAPKKKQDVSKFFF